MNDYVVYSGDTGGQLSMNAYETYQSAWENRGGPKADNILHLKAGMAVKNTAGEVLVRATDLGVESYRDDIYQIPVVAGLDTDEVMISLPAGQYVFCQENPLVRELALHMTGTELAVAVTTSAREAVVQVDDGSMIASAQISQPGSHYAIEVLNTFGQAQEEVFLNGMTGAEALHLVQKDGKLYAAGLTERCALRVNNMPQSLDCIRPLSEELPEESEPEMNLNATVADKNADNED